MGEHLQKKLVKRFCDQQSTPFKANSKSTKRPIINSIYFKTKVNRSELNSSVLLNTQKQFHPKPFLLTVAAFS